MKSFDKIVLLSFCVFFIVPTAGSTFFSHVRANEPDISEMGIVKSRDAERGELHRWVIFRGPFRNYQPEKDHLDHGRHRIKHGDSMPSEEPASERFTTTRTSEVVLKLPKEDDAFTFLIFGDRSSGTPEEISVLADAVHDANLIEPDFVITVGDQVMGYNTTEKWLREADEFKSVMNELKCPWFPVVGNHDMQWRGPNPPRDLHEANYEKHLGPTWYAFEHKNCWFIVLFTDESDEKGRKVYSTPERQKMSKPQLRWLKQTLKKTEGADHVFLFMHHPRWMKQKSSYRNVWDPIHKLLVEAGNVTAVFAGHIHHFSSEKRDGIEYMTLSTTGGRLNPAGVPRIGYTHNFFQVSVRKNRLGIAAIPVSAVIDPRTVSEEVRSQIQELAGKTPPIVPVIPVAADGTVDARAVLHLKNTTSMPIDVTAALASEDSRWQMTSHPWQYRLEPGQQREIPFTITRPGCSIDPAFRIPMFKLNVDCHLQGKIVSLPEKTVEIPLDLAAPMLQSSTDRQAVLRLYGCKDRIVLPSVTDLRGQKSLTLETWFQARETKGLAVLVGKGKESDFALSLDDGVPQFHLPLGHFHHLLENRSVKIRSDRWHHLAGVYDGRQIRLYLDGDLVAQETPELNFSSNAMPFILGSEQDRDGRIVYSFNGMLDSVRLSASARYAGESFRPQRDFQKDKETLFLLDMQQNVGPFIPFGDDGKYGEMIGDTKIIPESDLSQ